MVNFARLWHIFLFAVFLCVLQPLALAQGSGATAPQVSSDYVVGPEDIVTVTVLRHPEFSGDFYVPASSIINFPVVGNVNVSGMTLAGMAKFLKERFKVRLLKPEISVALKIARIQRVYVFGNVQKPGVLDLKTGWSVSEAIAAAGGLANGIQTSDVQVTLERADQKPIIGTLTDALSIRASEFDLKPGDTLRIESIPLVSVYVSGRVKAPGMVALRNDSRTVLAAIAQAGGMTEEASSSNVKIVRQNGVTEVVDLTPVLVKDPKSAPVGPLPLLNPGDMVIVPESQDRIAVLGFVSKPGYYPLPEGHNLSLADAVALASGNSEVISNRGRLSRVCLIRKEGVKDVRVVYDLGKFLKKGDTTQNPQVRAGDIVYIPESNRVEIGTALSGLGVAAIFLNLFRN